MDLVWALLEGMWVSDGPHGVQTGAVPREAVVWPSGLTLHCLNARMSAVWSRGEFI